MTLADRGSTAMKTSAWTQFVAGAVLWLPMSLLALAASTGAAQESSPSNPASSRLFTAAQVTRGKVVYEQACAACHGAALEGAGAATLAGPSFQARWRHQQLSVDDLFYVVRKTMP